MRKTANLLSISILGAVLAGCVDESSETSGTTAPTAAQQACLNAVANSTNNPQVSVLSSQFSEAGTSVKVGVGPDSAPWACIAYNDGSTDGIMSLTNEGSL